jgi:serine protease inhibitor
MNRMFVLLLGLVFLFSCTKQPDDYFSIPDDKEALSAKQVIGFREANADFAIRLFREIVTADSLKDNSMISPLSVSIALSMLNNGAAGNTKTEIKNSLGYYNLTDYCINKGFRLLINELRAYNAVMKLNLANSAWFNDDFPVKENFTDVSRQYFDAEVRNMDFQAGDALDSINTWVNRETEGKISELFSEMPEIVFLLCNAINFQGYWKTPFDAAETESKKFYFDGGGYKNTPTMLCNSTGTGSPLANFSYLYEEDFKAVKMPYGRKKYSEAVIKTVRSSC